MNKPKRPKYLSPSALANWEKDPESFFQERLCVVRTPRQPQLDVMAVGSAFDALVKSKISYDLFGEDETIATGYRIRDLVALQCQPHTLPQALEIAVEVFEEYLVTGAYRNLKNLLESSTSKPRMEFDVTGTVGGVPLLGKPDLHFNIQNEVDVITDWKVSGSMSKSGVSPQQGYKLALDSRGSRTHCMSHKKYVPVQHHGGIEVSGLPMDKTTDYWADQLSTYAWCLGHPVGSQDFIVRIEQLACRTNTKGERNIKCVTHQSTVSREHQRDLLSRYQRCWYHIDNDHVFADVSKAQSQARCHALTLQKTAPGVRPSQLTLGGFLEIDWGIAN